LSFFHQRYCYHGAHVIHVYIHQFEHIVKLDVTRDNVDTLGTAEGQRSENKHLTTAISSKITENPYTDVQTMGICTVEGLPELKKIGLAMLPEGSAIEQFVAALSTVKNWVYGGQHQFRGTRRAVPFLKDVEEKNMVKNRSCFVYCGVTRAEKIHLCNEHNDVADLHIQMTHFDKIVIGRHCFMDDVKLALSEAKANSETRELSRLKAERYEIKDVSDATQENMRQLLSSVTNKFARNVFLKVFMVSEQHWKVICSINQKTTNGQLKGQVAFAEGSDHAAWYGKYGKKYELKVTQFRELFGGLNAPSRLMLLTKIDGKEMTTDEAVKAAKQIKRVEGTQETIVKYYSLMKGEEKTFEQLRKEFPVPLCEKNLLKVAGQWKRITFKKAKMKELNWDDLSELEKLKEKVEHMPSGMKDMCQAVAPDSIVTVDQDDSKFDFQVFNHPLFGELKWCIIHGEVSAGDNTLVLPQKPYKQVLMSVQYGYDMYIDDKPEYCDSKATSEEEIKAIVEHAIAYTQSDCMGMLVWHGLHSFGDALKAVSAVCGGDRDRVEHLVWHKTGPWRQQGPCVSNNTDMGAVGYWIRPGSDAKLQELFSCSVDDQIKLTRVIRANPLNSKFKTQVDGKDVVINKTQMNHRVEYEYLKVRTKPQDWVLAPCSGAGSTILAALIAGNNVVAYDRRASQVKPTVQAVKDYLFRKKKTGIFSYEDYLPKEQLSKHEAGVSQSSFKLTDALAAANSAALSSSSSSSGPPSLEPQCSTSSISSISSSSVSAVSTGSLGSFTCSSSSSSHTPSAAFVASGKKFAEFLAASSSSSSSTSSSSSSSSSGQSLSSEPQCSNSSTSTSSPSSSSVSSVSADSLGGVGKCSRCSVDKPVQYLCQTAMTDTGDVCKKPVCSECVVTCDSCDSRYCGINGHTDCESCELDRMSQGHG
jgi:hypothetical protein